MDINKIVLKRHIDAFLIEWRNREDRLPLIVKGARQIGKTYSIQKFAEEHYENIYQINFILQPEYSAIFSDGFEVDKIIKNLTLISPSFKFVPGKTLLFFDEIQSAPGVATSLKSFALDKRFDVICSGSLMGINYREIESNSVGYKEDFEMYSLDFEEFLWARGYDDNVMDELFNCLKEVRPLSKVLYDVISSHFRDYMVLGGMPAVVRSFVANGNFEGSLSIQRQILLDYEEDITKYAQGFEKRKILNIYRHITTFLAKENKKFQISKLGKSSRNRDYLGVVEWLSCAGIVNPCYLLLSPELPLKGNYDSSSYKLYYQDTGLLVASLDDEAQYDLRMNRNFNTYKGAIFGNVVADMLRKAGYGLYYYKNPKSTVEMDFFIRDADSLIPVEVKADDGSGKSLVKMTSGKYDDIKFGIKLCNRNIGFNGQFYTIPYFLTFMLRRFLRSVAH